ncbi:MAG: ABC transporter permease [DPANN group archaeon]|nr:ABC transporter permease [DPANN group archaeon]
MNFIQTFKLSISLAISEFKLRNERTYLGLIWYLLGPLLLFVLLLLVFHNRLGNNIESYPLYLLLGIIIFNFFQKTTTSAANGIIQNEGLIKSINFPTESIVISIVLRNIFEHLFEIIVFMIFLLFFNIPIVGIIFYILILLIMSLFIYGVSLILASLAVFFADINNVWTFLARLLWFATPIFYAVGGQTRLFTFNLFNPLYHFITVSRDIIIYQKMPEWWMIGGMFGFILIFFVIGLIVFNKTKYKFAEMI